VVAGLPADREEKTGRHAPANPRNTADQDRDQITGLGSGDLLLVAVARVDRPSDRDDQDCAGTRNFTAALKAYFPGLSSRATHLFYSIPDLPYKQAKAQAETSPRCSALR